FWLWLPASSTSAAHSESVAPRQLGAFLPGVNHVVRSNHLLLDCRNRSFCGFAFWAGVIMRRIMFLVLMFSSILAWAEDYYYWTVPYPDAQFKYDDFGAACKANNQYYLSTVGGSQLEVRQTILSP